MTAISAVPAEVLGLLADAVEEHALELPPRDRARIIRLCVHAVSFSTEPVATSRRVRARSAAQLLVGFDYPELDDRALGGLSLACECAAAQLS